MQKKRFVCQNFLLESPSITSVATGASFTIKDALSCKDTWIIYCAICTKCNLQDVGSTKTPFYTRWSNHKSHINCRQKTCTLTKHFIEKKCGFENLKVTVIEKVKIKTVENLENREYYFILVSERIPVKEYRSLSSPFTHALLLLYLVCKEHLFITFLCLFSSFLYFLFSFICFMPTS